ncbi:MAG: nucleotidyltransferase family protein [Lawsonibacter sp.]|jgi:molybdenum cofactor cytidylyltransferase
MPTSAAIILAAGLSSRMGRFKPLLPVGTRSMIERVVGWLRESHVDFIVVVTGYQHMLLAQHLVQADVCLVHNPHYTCTQMLDSLRLGLEALPDQVDRVLVTPADLPLVRPSTVCTLLSTPGIFVRPCYQGQHGHPVGLDACLLEDIRLYTGPGGLRDAVYHLGIPCTDVPVNDPGVCLSPNTPSEYESLLKYFHTIEREMEHG